MSPVTIVALVTSNELEHRLIRRRNFKVSPGDTHVFLCPWACLLCIWVGPVRCVVPDTWDNGMANNIVPETFLGLWDERVNFRTTTVQTKKVE